MNESNHKKVYWGNMMNLAGLYSSIPVKCYKENEFSQGIFWDKSGNFDVDSRNLGQSVTAFGCVKFTSEKKEDVELWTNGAKAVLSMLSIWSRVE